MVATQGVDMSLANKKPQTGHLINDTLSRKVIVNFSDGETIAFTPERDEESFFDIPLLRRMEIMSLRLQLNQETFTISRKAGGKTLPGFFYHLIERARGMMGSVAGLTSPVLSERIGFCYNAHGDSIAIAIDYRGLVNEWQKRVVKIKKLEKKVRVSEKKAMRLKPMSRHLALTERDIERDADRILKLEAEPMMFSIFHGILKENVFPKIQEVDSSGEEPESKTLANPDGISLNVPLFYYMPVDEKVDLQMAMEDLLEDFKQRKEQDEPLTSLEFPLLPRLPVSDVQPQLQIGNRVVRYEPPKVLPKPDPET